MKTLKLKYCYTFNTFKISCYKNFYKLGFYSQSHLFIKILQVMLLYKKSIQNSILSKRRILKQLKSL